MLRSLGLFWAFNRTTLVGLIGCLVIAGLVAVCISAFGPVEPATGRVMSFTVVGEKRVVPVALVEVDGRSVQVRQREHGPCRIGDEISLTRQNGLLGRKYSASGVPNPCRRPDAGTDVTAGM
jgi:hypothetical protein